MAILQKHAPLKKRYVRANQAPFMDKKHQQTNYEKKSSSQ